MLRLIACSTAPAPESVPARAPREARPTSMLPPPFAASTIHPRGEPSLLEEYCRAIARGDDDFNDDLACLERDERPTDVDGLRAFPTARTPSWSDMPTLRAAAG